MPRRPWTPSSARPIEAPAPPAPAQTPDPPPFQTLSSTMRVDALLSDWRAELPPELPREERERQLYERAWTAYLEGDYGFGLWCWHEMDRLTLALGGSLREAVRVLGAGRYPGFSHRLAIAERVPLERVHRPRKGEMSTPRPEAFVMPAYQALSVYAARAHSGGPRERAQFEIALGEYEERRRADPYARFFEGFRSWLDRKNAPATTPPAAP
jgi:hypothetical protein